MRVAVAIACVAVWLGAAPDVLARQDGVTGFQMVTGGPATCSGGLCHSPLDPNDDVFVAIEGPTQLSPGQSHIYRISIEEAVAGALDAQMGAGLNVALFIDQVYSVLDASALVDENTQILTEGGATDLTHQVASNESGPPFGSLGDFDYNVRVTAPEGEATLTLMAALNAFNGDFDSTGDKWNRAELEITVPEPERAWQAMAALAALTALLLRRRPEPARARSRSARPLRDTR